MSKISKTGEIKFPNFINVCAAVLGGFRDISNYELKESKKEFKRDGLRVDELGIKGELIFSHFLHSRGVEHVLDTMLGGRPICDWDIKINEKFLVDVKTMRTDSTDFMINENTHKKKRGKITHYVFVRLTGKGSAEYYFFSTGEVDNWKIKDSRFSKIYYFPFNEYKQQLIKQTA